MQAAERRIWPTLVVSAALLPLALVMSLVSLVLALAVYGGFDLLTDADALLARMTEIMQEPGGLLILSVPAQAALLSVALVAARLSKVPTMTRLGIRRPRVPLWSIPIIMLATPAVSLVNVLTMRLVGDEPGDQLEMLLTVFHESPVMAFVVTLVLLSLLPGLVEETLFRGYLLRGLLRRWHPALAIGFTSILFAAVHLDPQHAVFVLPLGVWCGVVAWRTGSVVPAMLCHAFANAYGMLATRWSDPEVMSTFASSWTATDVVVMAVSGVALPVAIVVLVRTRPS